MHTALCIIRVLVFFNNIIRWFAEPLEICVLTWLGATPEYLATTSLRAFPSAEVMSFIDDNIDNDPGFRLMNSIPLPQDIEQQLQRLNPPVVLWLAAIPFFAQRWDRHGGLLLPELEPFAKKHPSFRYFIAVVRAWKFTALCHAWTYQLASGHKEAAYGLLIFMSILA